MAAEQFAEVGVYCRLRPYQEGQTKATLSYSEEGKLTIADDKEVALG
jgi:hypothetical protein